MFCINCGTQLDDRSVFCPYCGANLSECQALNSSANDQQTQYQAQYQPPQQAQYQPAQQTYYQPQNTYTPRQPVQPPYQPVAYQPVSTYAREAAAGKKKRKKGLAIVLTVLIVLLLAAAAVVAFASGVFAGPNVKVGNAITRSADAYSKAAKFLPDVDFSGLKENRGYSADLTAKLHELNIDSYYDSMISMLEGASVKISNDFSMEERDFSLAVSPALGSAKLLTANAALRDNHLYISCPDVIGDAVYGANTETIGEDLQNLGADVDDLEYLSFNVFDLIEDMKALLEEAKLTEEDKEELKAACLAMMAAAEIEKVGKEEIDVNDTDVECTEYSVVIPEDAIDEVFDLLKDMLLDTDYEDLAEEMVELLFTSICSSKEIVDEIMADADFSSLSDLEYIFDSVEDILKELEDLEFTVYLADGYVMSVYWEDSIYDVDFEVTADFGGDGAYADTLGIEAIINDEYTITLESTGNHSAKGGNFTDETSIEVEFDGQSVKINFETEYDPENGDLIIDIGAAGVLSVTIEGIFTGGENALELSLDNIDVEVMGEDLISCALSLTVGAYEKRVSMSDPVLISSLTEEDLWDIMDEIEAQAYSWAMDLVAEYPELLELVL